MMRLSRLITILLIGLFLLPTGELDAARRKRKTAKTTKTTSSKKKRTKARRTKRKRKASTSAPKLSPEEQRTQDSLRLRHGGSTTIPRMGIAIERIANIEPMLTRFRQGDTTLTAKNIETLYFTREHIGEDAQLFGALAPQIDSAIRRSQYKEAYSLVQKGLWRDPLHIGFIKRACELSSHQKDVKRSNIYVWQIAELFHLISSTGDGKSPKTAMRVAAKEDARLYETLWLETPPEHILEEQSTPYRGCELLTLRVKDPKGGEVKRYYIVG